MHPIYTSYWHTSLYLKSYRYTSYYFIYRQIHPPTPYLHIIIQIYLSTSTSTNTLLHIIILNTSPLYTSLYQYTSTTPLLLHSYSNDSPRPRGPSPHWGGKNPLLPPKSYYRPHRWGDTRRTWQQTQGDPPALVASMYPLSHSYSLLLIPIWST